MDQVWPWVVYFILILVASYVGNMLAGWTQRRKRK